MTYRVTGSLSSTRFFGRVYWDGAEFVVDHPPDFTSEPEKPGPQVPFECHNPRPISAEDAMQAVRAMCKGG